MNTEYYIQERFADLFDDYEYYGWSPMYSDNEAKEKVLEFLQKYGKNYTDEDLKFITTNFLYLLGIKASDVRVNQIYHEIGAYKKENDPYYGYLNILKKYFSIDCNILDVASGCFPAWAHCIANDQVNLSNGKITLYDPMLVTDKPKFEKMILKKEFFQMDTSIKSYDLVTSILPYTITNQLLQKLLYDNMNFFVALGNNSGHQNNFDYFNKEETIEKVKNYVEKTNQGTLYIEKLGNDYNNHLPILIYKRK